MTKNQKQLWDAISHFEFDNPQIQFNFTDRLARENNWTRSYSKEVIEEYKKFIFLCCTTPNGVTPSDQVDQAWHLHLTYTKSYWIDFCKNTLGQEIHHNPTEGGTSERTKFDSFYSSTKEEYQKAFQQEPPTHIWPENQERFSEIHFERVNTHRNWIIKKPKFDWNLKWVAIITSLFFPFIIQAQTPNESSTETLFFILFVVIVLIYAFRNRNNNSDGSGCTAGSGCSSHSGCSSDSGCSSGCSSGCGGCGGGCS